MLRILLALALSLFLVVPAWAEDPVAFVDATLKAAVEEALWIPDPTPTDMLGLTSLTCNGTRPRDNPIESLVGLEYATNLQSLTLKCHLITDISPLSGLVNLRTLILQDNEIADISPLSGLTGLWTLHLERNEVSNVSAIAGMTELSVLSLHRNQVSDISPLTSLASLTWFDLRINPLDEAAYQGYIEQILANNPGIWFVYDPTYYRRILIESTAGGTVVDPGEGVFTYEYGTPLFLVAKPDPGYVFAGWFGTYCTSSASLCFYVDQDYDLEARFVSELAVLHVDDDAPNDPKQGDPSVSDPEENGTPEHPFDRIQEAIDVAAEGASIIVHPGTYRENIGLKGKTIQLSGGDPNDPNRTAYPKIEGLDVAPAVSFISNENVNCRLTGFVITRSRGESASAIRCVHSSPTVKNCLIVGNSAGFDGAAIQCRDSNAVFVNCTVTDNYAREGGAGIKMVDSHVALVNSIVWGNIPNEILLTDGNAPSIAYTDVTDGWPRSASHEDAGLGNIDADPLFARRGYWTDKNDPSRAVAPAEGNAVWMEGDYHLQSQAGRWDQDAEMWGQDEVTSPCIDAGLQTSPLGSEPAPNGDRINMGVYGGTTQASKTYPSP